MTRPLVKLTSPLVKLTRPLVNADQPEALPLVKLTKRPWSRTRPGSLGAGAASLDDLRRDKIRRFSMYNLWY